MSTGNSADGEGDGNNSGSSSTFRRGHRRTTTADIIERARIDVIVPDATNLDIGEYLDSIKDNANLPSAPAEPAKRKGDIIQPPIALALLAGIKQRRVLFYDEDVPLFIALQIVGVQDDALFESYNSRLAVSLEVHANDNQSQRGSVPVAIKESEGAILLFQKTIQENDGSKVSRRIGDTRISVWKLVVPVGHPKVKTSSPRVMFSASATIRYFPQEQKQPSMDDEYMKSSEPLGANLLETFRIGTFDKEEDTDIAPPFLSAHRVSRVVPSAPSPKELFRALGYAAKRSFSILPAINFKLRGSRLALSTTQNMVACLHLEATSHSNCEVRIDEVSLRMPAGTSKLIAEPDVLQLPLILRPQDEMILLYSLQSKGAAEFSNPITANPSLIKKLTVRLKGEAQVSDRCRPLIATYWDTTIDFTSSSITSSSRSAAPHLQKSLRPPAPRPQSQGGSGSRPVTPQHPQPSALAGVTDFLGLMITFTGPERVYLGEVFSWQVFVVNRGQRHRKLALVVPPKRRKGEGKVLPNPPQSVTEPVLEESVISSTYRSRYLQPAELIPLVNDVRIGPLAPNACHTVELRFMPLATGVLAVEGVRVIDLLTNEATDCRDLPSVISIRRAT